MSVKLLYFVIGRLEGQYRPGLSRLP